MLIKIAWKINSLSFLKKDSLNKGLLFVSLFFIFYASSNTSIDERYVIADSGLSLRQEKTVNSNRVALIPFGEKVTVLKISHKQEVIDKEKGTWIFVQWKERKGWVFDAFIEKSMSEKYLLKHHIFLTEIEKENSNYSFYRDSISIVDFFDGLYTVKYKKKIPKGDPPDLDVFAVWKRKDNSWLLLYERDTWGFVKLLVRDVNKDKIADLITWEGGCCSSGVTINIYLGKRDGSFSVNEVKRDPPIDIFDYPDDDLPNKEDFVLNSGCETSLIQGNFFSNDLKKRIEYTYYFNCNENLLKRK